MSDKKYTFRSLITQNQIDELSAIYDDYLFAVRQYESMLQKAPVINLAVYQMERLYNDQKPDFPWKIEFLEADEKSEYEDFLQEKIHNNTGHAYISLQHTNPSEDSSQPINYIPPAYMHDTMDMKLPAAVERYTIVYPKEGKIGKTDFFIDGWFKAKYIRQDSKEAPIYESFSDEKIKTEFRILVNLIESARRNKDRLEAKFKGFAYNVFADESIAPFENNILEILSSFAEKTQAICKDIYGQNDRISALKSAERDGFILSADVFVDYSNIRNLMRHQWDTMDELGYFRLEASEKNSVVRAEYLESYRKLCDKTPVQRMKSYVSVLPQLQHIMRQIRPKIFIRDLDESNNKFAAKLKEYSRQSPEDEIVVELNYPLESDKYKSLNKNLHKILPQIQVKDEYKSGDGFEYMEEDYQRRSWFLHAYHSLECKMMAYCMSRGKNLNNKAAWDYFTQRGIISQAESKKWKAYSKLRNILSHNHYTPALRQKLRNIENIYEKDLNSLETKLIKMYPNMRWVKKGVYEYVHQDGLRVVLDINNRQVILNPQAKIIPDLKQKGKIDIPQEKRKKDEKNIETFDNGAEVLLSGNKIIEFKTPEGVKINFEKRRINWSVDVQLLANAENFNVLQTSNYKLFTDKRLHISRFLEKNREQPIRSGDVCIMEYKHRAVVGRDRSLKEFTYKDAQNNLIKSSFGKINDNVFMAFSDGTRIIFQENGLCVVRGDKILSYENRREFIETYGKSSITFTPKSNSGR